MEFLNSVVNVIYHVNDGVLTRYTGDYEKFVQMYEVKRNQEIKAYERQQQEIERMEDFIARNKAWVATRGMANSRQKMLDKMEILEKPREKPKPYFEFREARTPSRFIVEGKDLVLGYGEPLTRPVSFTLERGQKIAVIGTNGLGKTTLLRTYWKNPAGSGSLSWEIFSSRLFEQEADRDSSETALETIWKSFPLTPMPRSAPPCEMRLTNEHITSQMKFERGEMPRSILQLMQREPTG
jgi:ATPase subunit of ABC transporter with duplicated ATPase domains